LPLPVFGTLAASRATARADLGVITAEATATVYDLRRRVALAWLELARVEAHLEQAEAIVDRQDKLADVAQKRFEAGDAPRSEVIVAKAEAARVRADAAAETLGVAAASAALAGELGWDPSQPLTAAGGIPAGRVPPLASLRGRAISHPDVRVAAANMALETAHIREAEKARYPKLSLSLEADIDDPTLPGNDFKAALSLELPLGGKTSAAVRAAELKRRAAELEREARRQALEGGIVAAYLRWQAAANKALAYDGEVLPAQREAAELARTAYREGQGSLISVLQAERSLIDAENQLIDAREDAASARVDLEQAVGGSL
jgi:outer membrane protein TolC